MGADTRPERSARKVADAPGARRRLRTHRSASIATLSLALMLAGFASGARASTAPEAASDPQTEPLHDARSVLQAADNPLSLSDEQRIRIGEIIALSNQFAIALKAELDDARADLKQKLDEPTPDFDAVMSEVERVGQLETQLRKHQIATLMSLRAQLSSEQRTGLTRLFETLSRGRARGETAAGAAATPPTAQNSDRPSSPQP